MAMAMAIAMATAAMVMAIDTMEIPKRSAIGY
jgi:hypothetical protein